MQSHRAVVILHVLQFQTSPASLQNCVSTYILICRLDRIPFSNLKTVVQNHYIQKQFSVLSSRAHRIPGAIQRFLRCLSGIMTPWRGSSGPYDSWHVRQYQINTPPRAYQARSRTKHFRRQSSITWLACDVGGEGAQ